MRRFAAALTLGLALTATAAASPAAASAPHDTTSKPSAAATGYDVSYPQCSTSLPSEPKFGIVGVDGGRVLKPNPCLTTLITWARTATESAPAYYVNTGNPGPLLSSHWPSGQQAPEICATTYPESDSEACAYDYGWNNAADAYSRASAAAAVAGAPEVSSATWWLDVETGNSWEALLYGATPAYLANDTAALQGTVDQLRSQGVSTVGVYSTTEQWNQITGGATLGNLPVWYAGTGSLATAQTHCSSVYSFTGGPVALSQWESGGFDADWRC
jgi:hypothetical protein